MRERGKEGGQKGSFFFLFLLEKDWEGGGGGRGRRARDSKVDIYSRRGFATCSFYSLVDGGRGGCLFCLFF